MDTTNLINFIIQILIAAFGCTGLMEYIKNFLKVKAIWYALIMPFLGVFCFWAVYSLPLPIIGGILTVGTVQVNYQVIVQGFSKILELVKQKLS